MRLQEFHDTDEIRPATIIGVVLALIAVGITGWVMMRTIADNQAAAEPEPFTSTIVDGDDLDTSIAGEQAEPPERPASDQFELGDVDLDTTPTTQPEPAPDPSTPTTQPKPPKKTPETKPPPPPNEPPAVEELVVSSEGGQLKVRATVADPEADLASISVVVGQGNLLVATQSIDPTPNASSQKISADFVIDTSSTAKQNLAVTVSVTDGAGDRDSRSVEHEVVRRTKVVVSPVSMSLNSVCFDHPQRPALALTGELVAAGLGVDYKTTLSGEFRKDRATRVLSEEQVGYVDGGKEWFVLVTATPDLIDVKGQITNLGKIQTLHKQSGSFVKPFDKDGCTGAISYTITASLV